MNIVMITTGARPELFNQSMKSLKVNAVNPGAHTLTVVKDGKSSIETLGADTFVLNAQRVGASASRNIGAGSIRRYKRHSHVLFLDDDVFMCLGWDQKMTELAAALPSSICSGYSHPFNHAELKSVCGAREVYPFDVHSYGEPLVISSVAMMMPWSIFDEVGPWDEPGGPGGSEDYALCMRAKAKGYGFAVTEPQCVIHTGILSSSGVPIVGQKELCEQNDKLLDVYGIRGKVIFQ